MNKNRIKSLVLASSLCTVSLSMMPGAWAVQAQESDQTVTASSALTTSGGKVSFNRGKASIVIAGNADQSLKGKEFSLYKIFSAQTSRQGESINYTFHPETRDAVQSVIARRLNIAKDQVSEYRAVDYIQTLNSSPQSTANAGQPEEGRYSDMRYFIEDLRSEIQRTGVPVDVISVRDTTADNEVILEGLDYGYYLVDETASQGTHSATSLCMVTTASPDQTIHIKSDYPLVSKQIFEDDNETGWNDISDAEIGQRIPYRFNTYAPNMSGYESYRMIFHDEHDAALTFHPESVRIEITGTDGSVLELSAYQFEVRQTGESGFSVEIMDLKKIIDARWPGELDENKESSYGQSIRLYFEASLNEKAAEQTGRPGFENRVRLEFSNNPNVGGSETGFTPWDTVVTFTYRMDSVKVNEADQVLEGAKFRLYRDADLRDEVFLKKAENGTYTVLHNDALTQGSAGEEMISHADGTFVITGLDQGVYYLKETQAPDGYRPLLDPIQISVRPEFTEERNSYVQGQGATQAVLKNLTATASITDFYDGREDSRVTELESHVETGSFNLAIVNRTGKVLPGTGGAGSFGLAGLGITLAGGGLYFRRRGRKQA